MDGDPEKFEVTSLAARLGASNLGGSIRVDLEGKPQFKGELTSEVLDVAALLAALREQEAGASGSAASAGSPVFARSKSNTSADVLIARSVTTRSRGRWVGGPRPVRSIAAGVGPSVSGSASKGEPTA